MSIKKYEHAMNSEEIRKLEKVNGKMTREINIINLNNDPEKTITEVFQIFRSVNASFRSSRRVIRVNIEHELVQNILCKIKFSRTISDATILGTRIDKFRSELFWGYLSLK